MFEIHSALQMVLIGTATLGAVSGALGSFAVLRRQSLLGDAISHAALPGVAIAYWLTLSTAPVILTLGAAATGWLGTLLILRVIRATRVPFDAALGGMLSVFFGIGILLLTYLQQNRPAEGQGELEHFLKGQPATMLPSEVHLIMVLAVVALTLVAVFWKEFKLLSFDPGYAESQGWPIRRLDLLLMSLLVIAIVAGIKCVGTVLMSALVVAPAAAARQWTNRLGLMVLLGAAFGAASGAIGALLSDALSKPRFYSVPTGPTIVLTATVIVAVSLLFAPERGLLWRLRRRHLSQPAVES